jgi:hypothetical protein
MYQSNPTEFRPKPRNKGKLAGQKPPLKLKEIWALLIRLQPASRLGDLALFNLAIVSYTGDVNELVLESQNANWASDIGG